MNKYGNDMNFSFQTFAVYPVKIVFVDDDLQFSKNIRKIFDDSQVVDIISTPDAAHEFFNNYQLKFESWNLNNLEVNSLSDNNNLLTLQHSIMLDILKIRTQITDSPANSEIAVLVVDYSLPETTGVDLCRNLDVHSFKKLMITGVADEVVAVKAFNNGLIDKFLSKLSPNFLDDLTHSIDSLKLKYFEEKSKVIIKLLSTLPFWCLHSPEILLYLREKLSALNIVKYCIIDLCGSLLVEDIYGKKHVFLLANKAIINEYTKIAKNNGISEDIVKKLENGKMIPALFSEESYNLPVTQWNNALLRPAEKISDNFFCSRFQL